MVQKMIMVVAALMFSSAYAQVPAEAKQMCYQSAISYPQLTKGNEVVANFIASMQAQLTQALIANADVTTICSPDNNITITYQQFVSADNYLSLLFQSQMTYPHLAHPVTTLMALNYDLNAQQQLSLSDVFTNVDEALTTISSYSYQTLSKSLINSEQPRETQKITAKMLQEGTAPIADNYKYWNLSKAGIVITFSPAQVAAAYMGKLQVVIPFSELTTVLQPQFLP